MVSGAIWYRLLIAKRPLDGQFARALTEMVLQLSVERPVGLIAPGDLA
jgi:hypothetical protein